MSAPRRAVIGSGIAGLAAAHVLSTRGAVTLYEADARLGGAMAFRDGRMGVDQILAVRPHVGGGSDVEPVRPAGW